MNILVADDDPVARAILEKHLAGWGYRPFLCSGGIDAWNELRRGNFPLAVLDWMMPGIQGPDLVRKVRAQKKSGYTYLILLSSKRNRRDVLSGLAAGADDYLTKPLHPAELRARLKVGERILNLEKSLLQAQNKLQQLAYSDSVTGLWNRRKIMEFLHEEIVRSARQRQGLGLILMDIDRFKKINDRHGHPAGDRVLAELAKRLKKQSRPYDRVGRLGGDEMMILMPGCGGKDIRRAAERLREAVAARPFAAEGAKIPVTVSLGAATTDGLPGRRAAAAMLIHSADQALYRAKREGRNLTIVHSSPKRNNT